MPVHLLDGAVQPEQRGDLNQAADSDDDQDGDDEQERVPLEALVFVQI